MFLTFTLDTTPKGVGEPTKMNPFPPRFTRGYSWFDPFRIKILTDKKLCVTKKKPALGRLFYWEKELSVHINSDSAITFGTHNQKCSTIWAIIFWDKK